MNISILCPTRGRPLRFAEMASSAIKLAEDPNEIEILAYLDADDPKVKEYPELPRVSYFCGPRVTVSRAFNVLYEDASSDIVMSGADDLIFRTPKWDTEVTKAFALNRASLVVPLDGVEDKRGRRTTHFFASREWVDLVGYFLPEEYEHFYSDTHLEDIALRAKAMVWLDTVLVEHMHPNHGKAVRDSTYDDKRRVTANGRMSERDGIRFGQLAEARALAADRIRSAA